MKEIITEISFVKNQFKTRDIWTYIHEKVLNMLTNFEDINKFIKKNIYHLMININVSGRIYLIENGYIENIVKINKINYLMYMCPYDNLIKYVLENNNLNFDSIFKYNKLGESLFTTIIIQHNQLKNFKFLVENEKFDKSYLFLPNYKGLIPIHLIFKYCSTEFLEYFIETFTEAQYYTYENFNNQNYLYDLIIFNFDNIDIVLKKLNLNLNNILNEEYLLKIFYLFFEKIKGFIDDKKLSINIFNSLYENSYSFNPIRELLYSSEINYETIDLDERLNKIYSLIKIEDFNLNFWIKNDIKNNLSPLIEFFNINERTKIYLDIFKFIYKNEKIKEYIENELLNNYNNHLSLILYLKRNNINNELVNNILDKITLQEKNYSINMVIIGLIDDENKLKDYNIDEQCPICFENVNKVTNCLHGYCEDCYNKLETCAICRIKNI